MPAGAGAQGNSGFADDSRECLLGRLSFPIHDMSGGEASSTVWAFYVQVAVRLRLPYTGRHFVSLSECAPQKSAAAPGRPLFRKGSAGISMPQPLWNIESLENLSQIVPKGHRSRESYTTENTSRDEDRGSVSKGVGSETASPTTSRAARCVTWPEVNN